MAGFSGAVEDGVRGVGTVISIVVAVIVGWIYGSFSVGLGVFFVGYVVALIWGHIAGENFRASQIEGTMERRDVGPSDPDRQEER